MSDNENPRATGEAVAWALCDDEGVFDVEQDEATAKEWVRGGADCGLVRWLRPLVFGDVAHPAPRVAVTVTEAMVEAACKVWDSPDSAWSFRRAMRQAITAALQNAASEGASA